MNADRVNIDRWMDGRGGVMSLGKLIFESSTPRVSLVL